VEYLGVICMVLVTRQPLVPYYVVNIADERVPFTGIIGMSNLVSTEETAGLHLTFLPKYVHSDDALLRAPESQLRELFFAGLRVMFPQLSAAQIESMHINRAVKVQPLQVLGYSHLVPSVRTAHPDFFVLNTAQLSSSALNNNEVVRLVEQFLDDHRGAFTAAAGASAPPRPLATPHLVS
jgi:protoporphyrinogen oxidase